MPSTFYGTNKNDSEVIKNPMTFVYDALDGIDTISLGTSKQHEYTIAHAADGAYHVDSVSGASGILKATFYNVERLIFSDQKLALDLNGNAGSVAKILGAVFGAAAVARPDFVGIGLSLLDSGQYDATSLMGFALDFKLGKNANPQAVVDLLYLNVVGALPDAQTEKGFVDLLNSHNAAWLGDMAANTELNKANIHLTGLEQTGLAYS
jgi:hypothetical protein